MRCFFWAFVAAIAVAGFTPDQAAAQSFSRGNGLVNDAAHALDRGKWDKGVALAREALRSGELSPRNLPAALNNLCIGLTGQTLYDEAMDTCNRAIDLRPREWSFYNNRANIHFYRKQYDRALADYYKALTFSPGDDVLISNISLALRERRRFNENLGVGDGERQS